MWRDLRTVFVYDREVTQTYEEGIHDFEVVNMSGNVLGKPYYFGLKEKGKKFVPNEINTVFTDEVNEVSNAGLIADDAATVYWFVCAPHKRFGRIIVTHNYLKTKLVPESTVHKFFTLEMTDFDTIDISNN